MKSKKIREYLKMIFKLLIGILALIAIGISIYAYNNLNYDRDINKLIEKSKTIEKQVMLPDGAILNYGEGEVDKGIPLLLLHGQMVSWEDYAKVLPELSKKFHIYALDYYGHGGSSKDPRKYSAEAIGRDIIWFIENVIKEPVVISGHSSGGLLGMWVASNSPQNVRGLIIEDAPIFSTEPGFRENTIAWLGFKDIYEFLNQDEITNFTLYSLKYDYMQTLFNDGWNSLVYEPAKKQMEGKPGVIPRLWYMPVGLNRYLDITRNLQDGTGEYDLRFGVTFYYGTWFKNFDQREALEKIQCPTVLLHTTVEIDKNGILLGAMTDENAIEAASLLADNVFIDQIDSGHDIHYEKPQIVIDAINSIIPRLQ